MSDNKMLKKKLGIDEKDLNIIDSYMKNANVSQKEIADALKLSQPSVFVRIQKLKKKGLLRTNIGIEFTNSNLFMCRIDLTSKNPNGLLNELKICPFFVNGFIISGESNVSVMFAHQNLQKIDEIVNNHLRKKESVSNVKLNVIVSSAKDYIFQIDLNNIDNIDCVNQENCNDCQSIDLK
jgi:Lrp/AsnC family transcriptional regulator, leucine-responsive regulatory protein